MVQINCLQKELILDSVDVCFYVDIDQIRVESDDEYEVGELNVTRSQAVNLITGLPGLTKKEYIHRVIFGAWIEDRIFVQSFYDENEH